MRRGGGRRISSGRRRGLGGGWPRGTCGCLMRWGRRWLGPGAIPTAPPWAPGGGGGGGGGPAGAGGGGGGGGARPGRRGGRLGRRGGGGHAAPHQHLRVRVG